jgi:peptidoglycan hydrolase-like protein with peptidoglycan-binding domain
LRRLAKEKAMIKFRNVAALLALASVAALPACATYGDGYYSSQPSGAYASRSPALSQDMVRQVQTRLQQAGAYNGGIDGIWGPQTEAAVRSYQQQRNLNVTGQLDGDTLASLNLGGTNQNPGNLLPLANAPPVAVAPPVANAQPIGNAPPASQVSGANNTAPITTNMPPSTATQSTTSTTP